MATYRGNSSDNEARLHHNRQTTTLRNSLITSMVQRVICKFFYFYQLTQRHPHQWEFRALNNEAICHRHFVAMGIRKSLAISCPRDFPGSLHRRSPTPEHAHLSSLTKTLRNFCFRGHTMSQMLMNSFVNSYEFNGFPHFEFRKHLISQLSRFLSPEFCFEHRKVLSNQLFY